MAFTLITSTQRYACLFTDTKPTDGVKLGSLAMETDTGKEFVFNGTTWVPYSQQVSITGSLPKLRRESIDPEPTLNDDGSVLIKYQTLWIMDTNVWKYWNGTSWVVMG